MSEKNSFSLRRDEIISPDKPIIFKGNDGCETYKIDDYTIGVRPKWISVEDEKPKIGLEHRYLFLNGKGEVTYGYAFDIEDERIVWINDMDRETNEIATHWMPLPKPPGVKDEA